MPEHSPDGHHIVVDGRKWRAVAAAGDDPARARARGLAELD
jgi:hypothetical protein